MNECQSPCPECGTQIDKQRQVATAVQTGPPSQPFKDRATCPNPDCKTPLYRTEPDGPWYVDRSRSSRAS